MNTKAKTWFFKEIGIAIVIIIFTVVILSSFYPKHIEKTVETVAVVEQRLPVFEFVSYKVCSVIYSEVTSEEKAAWIIPYGYKMMYQYTGSVELGADCSNLTVKKIGEKIYVSNVPEIEILSVHKASFKLLSATQDSARSLMGRGIPIQDIFDSINLEDELKKGIINDGISLKEAKRVMVENIRKLYAPLCEEVIIEVING